ncbi:30S ribosomal protein S17 [Candidatus Omnitrophota bacterium]
MARIRRKILEGYVTSAKMEKTIVVRVGRIKKHSVYKRNSGLYKKFKAHDEKEEAQQGDFVKIVESRPLSKEKRFKLLEIAKKKVA